MGNGKTVKNARCTAFDDANEPASVVSWKERTNSDPLLLLLLLLRILRYGDTLSATNYRTDARVHTHARVCFVEDICRMRKKVEQKRQSDCIQSVLGPVVRNSTIVSQ